jgi:lysophospholipid acyltransferase (LPLAT)-like uncharacterized protein
MTYQLSNLIKGNALYLYSIIVSRTCRFRITGEERIFQLLETGKPIIGTSWHGMTQMVLGSMRKYIDLSTLVTIFPDDYRGEILAVFAGKLGIRSKLLNLAGDSTLDMARKLVHIINSISSGDRFIIHPDGPEGPAYVVKPGLTFIAKKTGAMILPLGCYCRNAYHVPRWDRYTCPLPFSKVQVYVGEPFMIPETTSDLSAINQELTDILNRAAAQAAADYYEL